jgi:hypothetical protein
MKLVSDLRQVCGFLRVLRFLLTIKLTATLYLNIVESVVKYHKTNQPNHFGHLIDTVSISKYPLKPDGFDFLYVRYLYKDISE